MKKFTKNPALDVVILPGHGHVRAGELLEGDELARFAPKYLTEVPEVAPVAPLETRVPLVEPAPALTEPAPVPVAPVVETPVVPETPVLTEEVPNPEPPAKPARASKSPPKNAT